MSDLEISIARDIDETFSGAACLFCHPLTWCVLMQATINIGACQSDPELHLSSHPRVLCLPHPFSVQIVQLVDACYDLQFKWELNWTEAAVYRPQHTNWSESKAWPSIWFHNRRLRSTTTEVKHERKNSETTRRAAGGMTPQNKEWCAIECIPHRTVTVHELWVFLHRLTHSRMKSLYYKCLSFHEQRRSDLNNYDWQNFKQVFTGVPVTFKYVFTGVPKIRNKFSREPMKVPVT